MRLLLVEDDVHLAAGLKLSLHNEGYAVNHVSTGAEALRSISTDDCDIVILDLGLPDMDGTAILRHLRDTDPVLPVLILSARDGLDDRISGLDLGADDYIAKPFEMPELLARLRVIERRLGTVQTSIIEISGVAIDVASHRVSVGSQDIQLSRREYMVLKALMERAGRVMSREQLESNLYEWGEEVTSNTIEVHIHHLRQHLPADFIKTIRGVGYRVSKS